MLDHMIQFLLHFSELLSLL